MPEVMPPHANHLLKAIVKHPADDTRRVVWADWLEEHGDAERAEFIRVQIEMAKLAEDDPRYHRLRAREGQLHDKNWEKWSEKVTGFKDRVTFRRGLPEAIRVEAYAFSRVGRKLCPRCPVSEVALSALSKEVAPLADSPYLPRIRALSFYHDIWEVEEGNQSLTRQTLGTELASWPALPNLVSLELGVSGHSMYLNDTQARALARAPLLASLNRLVVSEAEMTPAGVKALLGSRHLANLSELVVDGVGLGPRSSATWSGQPRPLEGAIDALAPLSRMPGLRVLKLCGLGIGDGAATVVARAHNLSRLEHLDLFHNLDITDVGATALASAPHLGGLRSLRLADNKIGGDGARALASSPHLAQLTDLDLSQNWIEDPGGEALAASPHLRRLEKLDLNMCGIGNQGIDALAASPNLANLTRLRLGHSKSGIAGLRALGRSAHLQRLQFLELGHWQLDGKGMAALVGAGGFPSLRCLDLEAAKVDDEALAVLAGSPVASNLVILRLPYNHIGDAGAQALAAAPMPNLASVNLSNNSIGDAGADALLQAPWLGNLGELQLRDNKIGFARQSALEGRLGKRVWTRYRMD